MRRLLLVIPLLLLAAGAAFVVGSGQGDDPQDAIVAPFPRPLKPLPVPEVHINQGHWADPVPTAGVPAASPPTMAPDALDECFRLIPRPGGPDGVTLGPAKVCGTD